MQLQSLSYRTTPQQNTQRGCTSKQKITCLSSTNCSVPFQDETCITAKYDVASFNGNHSIFRWCLYCVLHILSRAPQSLLIALHLLRPSHSFPGSLVSCLLNCLCLTILSCTDSTRHDACIRSGVPECSSPVPSHAHACAELRFGAESFSA